MPYPYKVKLSVPKPCNDVGSGSEVNQWRVSRVWMTRYAGWTGFFVLVLLSLACSAAEIVQRTAATPVLTRALVPTFTATPRNGTPLPQIIITPPNGSTPGVIIIPEGMDPAEFLPTPTITPVPTLIGQTPFPETNNGTSIPPEQQTLLPTATPISTSTPEPTFTPTPTPYVLVDSGLVTLRTGPGVEYPLVAQLGPQIPIAIVGQSPEGDWYQLCCVNGGTVWVASSHVRTINDPSNAPQFVGDAPPQPTPTSTPTPTLTVTPTPTATLFPFDRYTGPQFFPTQNEFLTIWVKLFVGTPPNEDPAPGYYLRVLFEGIERPATNGVNPSADALYAVGVPGTGYSNLSFNVKYEYRPPDPNTLSPTDPNHALTRNELIGTGTWRVYVVDGAGNQLSDVVEFRTEPGNPNREVYIAWIRVR